MSSETVLTNNGVNVQIPRNLYSSLISPENFSSDMSIGPSTINKIIVSADNSSQIHKQSTINYTAILTPQLLYSNKVEIEGNIHLTFSNVKVKQSYEMVASSMVLPINDGRYDTQANAVYFCKDLTHMRQCMNFATINEITGSNATPIDLIKRDNSNSTKKSGGYSSLSPNPFQAPEMALSSSFLNCMYSSSLSLSTNGNAVSLSDTTPRFHDLQCRMLDKNYTESVYDGALVPDKNIIRKQMFYGLDRMATPLTSGTINDTEQYSVVSAIVDRSPRGKDPAILANHELVGRSYQFGHSKLPTYYDADSDVNNANSKLYRGRVEKNCTYTFKKAKPSLNYKVELDRLAGQLQSAVWIKPTVLTTELRTVYINGYAFPTHFEASDDISDELLYDLLGDLMFFRFNNLSPIVARTNHNGNDDETHGIMFVYMNEPADQSLIIEKVYNNLCHPLFNPLLCMHENESTYSNTSLFKCTLSRTSASMVDCLSYIGNINLSEKSTASNIVNVDFKVSNLTLNFNQYSMNAMESSIKPISTLFYSNWSIARESAVSITSDEIRRNKNNGYVTKKIS